MPLRGQANHLWVIQTDFPQGYVHMSSSVPALSDTNKGGTPVDKPETTVLVPVAPLIYYLRVSLDQVIQTLQPWVGFQQAADFAGYNSLGTAHWSPLRSAFVVPSITSSTSSVVSLKLWGIHCVTQASARQKAEMWEAIVPNCIIESRGHRHVITTTTDSFVCWLWQWAQWRLRW